MSGIRSVNILEPANGLDRSPSYPILNRFNSHDPFAKLSKNSKELLLNFKGPAFSPHKLSNIETRNLLDSCLKLLNTPNEELKRYTARVLAEDRARTNLHRISVELYTHKTEDEAYDIFTFITRALPLMKVLGHPFFGRDPLLSNTSKFILDTTFPESEMLCHLIVRSCQTYLLEYTIQENEAIDWIETFQVMVHFFINILKRSTQAKHLPNEPTIKYWVPRFLECISNSWFITPSSRKRIFDAVSELITLCKLEKFFLMHTLNMNDLSSIRIQDCIGYRYIGECMELDEDQCFFHHRSLTITDKYLDPRDPKYTSADNWARFGASNEFLTSEQLTKYWDEALNLFNSGYGAFVVESISQSTGLVHIKQVIQPNPENKAIPELSQIESFLKLITDPELEAIAAMGGYITAIAEACAEAVCLEDGLFLFSWNDIIESTIRSSGMDNKTMRIASLLVAFGKFILLNNPLQLIEDQVKYDLRALSLIVASHSNQSHTMEMRCATEIISRLGYSLSEDPETGNLELIDEDVPVDEAEDYDDDAPLVFNDEDYEVPQTRGSDDSKTSSENRRILEALFCIDVESAVEELRKFFAAPIWEADERMQAMENSGKMAILRKFCQSERSLITTSHQSELSILHHLFPLLEVLGGTVACWDFHRVAALRDNMARILRSLLPEENFLPFLRRIIQDFYVLDDEHESFDKAMMARYQRGAGHLMLVIIAIERFDVAFFRNEEAEGLMLRLLRIFTGTESPEWDRLHSKIIIIVDELELQSHFKVVRSDIGGADRLKFRLFTSFSCPQRFLSRCDYPTFCRFAHLAEGTSDADLSDLDEAVDAFHLDGTSDGSVFSQSPNRHCSRSVGSFGSSSPSQMMYCDASSHIYDEEPTVEQPAQLDTQGTRSSSRCQDWDTESMRNLKAEIPVFRITDLESWLDEVRGCSDEAMVMSFMEWLFHSYIHLDGRAKDDAMKALAQRLEPSILATIMGWYRYPEAPFHVKPCVYLPATSQYLCHEYFSSGNEFEVVDGKYIAVSAFQRYQIILNELRTRSEYFQLVEAEFWKAEQRGQAGRHDAWRLTRGMLYALIDGYSIVPSDEFWVNAEVRALACRFTDIYDHLLRRACKGWEGEEIIVDVIRAFGEDWEKERAFFCEKYRDQYSNDLRYAEPDQGDWSDRYFPCCSTDVVSIKGAEQAYRCPYIRPAVEQTFEKDPLDGPSQEYVERRRRQVEAQSLDLLDMSEEEQRFFGYVEEARMLVETRHAVDFDALWPPYFQGDRWVPGCDHGRYVPLAKISAVERWVAKVEAGYDEDLVRINSDYVERQDQVGRTSLAKTRRDVNGLLREFRWSGYEEALEKVAREKRALGEDCLRCAGEHIDSMCFPCAAMVIHRRRQSPRRSRKRGKYGRRYAEGAYMGSSFGEEGLGKRTKELGEMFTSRNGKMVTQWWLRVGL